MNRTRKNLFVVVALFALAVAAVAAYRSPAPLTLPVIREQASPEFRSRFFAVAGDRKVELSWTITEPSIRQFILERDGAAIARMESEDFGAEFQYLDAHLANNFAYTYILYGLDGGGERSVLGSQSATPNRERKIAREYSLGQNFPNPFNPRTQISFELPEQSFVRLTVYNSLGQTVAVLAESELAAGLHSVTFDGTTLSSGIYLYALNAGPFNQVRKMVLVK
jgi:hypothetical protein